MNEQVAAFDAGVTAMNPEASKESAEVTSWSEKVSKARAFDENARKQMAINRAYLRGDSNFEVSTNLVGSFSDTMVAFLYAKDPDVDVLLAEQVEPPKEDPPTPPPAPPADPVTGAISAQTAGIFEGASQQYAEAMTAYLKVMNERRRKREERRAFARTMSLVISRLWKVAKMKRRAKRMTRSALGVMIGVLKISWQQRTERDPETLKLIQDLQQQLAQVQATQQEMLEPGADREKLACQYRDQIKVLEQRAEVVVARGLAIDFVAAEDIQVSTEVDSILDYEDAGWVDHRIFLSLERVKTMFPSITADEWKTATKFSRTKPADLRTKETPAISSEFATEMSAERADSYQAGGEGADCVCIHETWDKESGLVRTWIEGMKRWAKPCEPPQYPTQRFYPFFILAMIEVDGERHPQSKTQRSTKLQDEYNRTRSSFAKTRRRSIPGIVFDETNISPTDARKLEAGVEQELIGMKPVNPDKPISASFAAKPTAPIEPALFDTSPIRADMEAVWGAQEALQGTIQTAKTATEAEIQQTGMSARTNSDRDTLEDVLTDMANYTAELAIQALKPDDVRKMVGDGAVWPEQFTVEDLQSLCTIQIRAGSSGKPNTTAQRQAWGAIAPVISDTAMKVGQLRQASPSEMADSLEAIAEETILRSGDRLDIERFVPQGNDAAQMPEAPPMGMPAGAMPVNTPPAAIPQPPAEGVM